jgi:tetratricopeptide (TPR) repeat protein
LRNKVIVVQPDELVFRILSDQESREKVDESLGIDVLTTRGEDGRSTTGLNGQFIHYQQLIDVLFRIKSRPTDRTELHSLCTEEYRDNTVQLAILEEYQNSYSPEKALWWYTRNSFLYKMLNKALRVQDIDTLFALRSFIRHIHRELKRYRCRLPIRVYRGQLMSTDELDTLRRSIGELISINSFFSTSTDPHIARFFLGDQGPSDDLQRVLFEIDADPRVLGIHSMKPFANISSRSNFASESEVLFMLGSIFRLTDIRCDHDAVLIIQMTLCGDDESDVQQLLKNMKKLTKLDLRSLGDVLKDMGKFELAEKYFYRSLNELPLNDPSNGFLYFSLFVVSESKGDREKSLCWLQKAIQTFKQTESSDPIRIGQLNNLVGETHRLKGDYNEALESYNVALSNFRQANADNHIKVIMIYKNISLVYQAQEKYAEALVIEEVCLRYRQDHLPNNHSELGLSYTDIGIIHHCLFQHDLALENLHESLKIKVKSLPPRHPDIGTSYQHIGLVYESKNELQQALTYLQKALIVYRYELPSHHRDIVKCEQDIQRLHLKLE